MNNNKWFKHYNAASESDGFKNAFAANDYKAAAFYWIVLEHISKHEDRENLPGVVALHERYWCKLLGTNIRGLNTFLTNFSTYFHQSLTIVWDKFGTSFDHVSTQFTYNLPPNFVLFFAPKWLELQETRGGKREAKKDVLPDRDKNKNKKKREEKGESAGADLIRLIWSEYRGQLPDVLAMGNTRQKHAEARWRENPDEAYWQNVVQKISASPFCNGENDRGWKADFDFLIKPDSHARVMEGKYDGKSSQTPKRVLVKELPKEYG